MPRLIQLVTGASAVFSFLISISGTNASADGIRLSSEYNFTTFDSETENKETGEKTETDSYELTQRYILDLSKDIFPFLTVRGGGTFDFLRVDSTVGDVDTERRKRIIQPFGEVNLRNPVYAAGIKYRRTEIKEETTDAPTAIDSKEEITGNLAWRPAGLPQFDFRLTRTHFSDNLDTVDLEERLMTLSSRYQEVKGLTLDYTYTRSETENRLATLDSFRQTHNGRVDYGRGFLDGRLTMDTGLRINYSTTELSSRAGAGGSVRDPLARSGGLFSLDNTPADGPALTSNAALIDGDTTASTGIDLGLDGDETTLTNIGLDFGITVSVDAIFVWVDRSLSAAVSDSFSWSIYTSPDNTAASTWTLRATVAGAPFGTFQNRFEIAFPAVETRFIKVVTRPLSPAVPGASSLPNIFVTDMEGFTTLSVQREETARTENFTLNYNLNLLARPWDRTTLGYNLFYRLDETNPGSFSRTTLTNGIYANHAFNDVFSAGARLFRDDRDETLEGKSLDYTYSASLRAAYLKTFSQTLSYSGTRLTEQEGSGYTNSVFLRNSASLYRGWDVFVDAGYSWNRPIEGSPTTSTIVRVGTNLLPNENLNINMNYTAQWSRESGEPFQLRQDLDLQASIQPFRTLSLFARVNAVSDESGWRTFQSYALNWSPFPEGALQFFFNYNEQLRSEDQSRDRVIGPGLRWRIRRGASLEMRYSLLENDSAARETDSKSLDAVLRILF